MVILCIWAAVSFVAGWIWRLYHATGDGRLFNYPVHLSRGPVGLTEVCVEAALKARRIYWAPRSPKALSSATNVFKAALKGP
jgi:hypothetical protein